MKLRHLLTSLCTSQPSRGDIAEAVSLCRRIAVVHLRKKVASRHLNPEFFSLPVEDIALDCIADLFRQDERGALLQVQAYFEGLDIDGSSDEELLIHVRRLTFSKVNQGLFRLYNENDPPLGRIHRNIKLAVQSLESFVLMDRFGDQCLAPALCDSLEHLPPFDRHELREQLMRVAIPRENIPTLLAGLSRLLREQTARSRIISVTELALTIRSMYDRPADAPAAVQPDDTTTADDARRIIEEVCLRVQDDMKKRYVEKKRVAVESYEHYWGVIRENLVARILDNDGEGFSFYDRLRMRIPRLSKEEYTRLHKSRIEYLSRIANERVIISLKRHL